MIITERISSNIQIALDTLRANKLRSALTILGVVIGVSTVMTMAAIVQGIQDQIVRTIEIAGPTTFYVVKVFSQTPVNPDRLPNPVAVRAKDPIRLAVRRMEQGGYRHLPVLDETDRPVGVLSVRAIVRYLVEHFPGAVHNLPPDPRAWPTEPDGA